MPLPSTSKPLRLHLVSSRPTPSTAEVRRAREMRHHAVAIRVISIVVRAFMESWPSSIAREKAAPFLGLGVRKLNGLYWKEPTQQRMTEDMAQQCRIGMEHALLWYADYLRARADYWEAVARQERAKRTAEGSACSATAGSCA